MSYYTDGRATGRRWPAEFNRSTPETVLPLVPDDAVVFVWNAPYGKVHPKRRVHLAQVGEERTLCGHGILEGEAVPEPLPLPLCGQCGLHLYTRRRWREQCEAGAAALAALDAMDVEELKRQIEDLQMENRYFLRKLAEHGLLLSE